MNPFAQRLAGGPCLLLDGGFGSMLIARGLAPGVPPESWVLDQPQEIRSVHRAYLDAGSEVVHAATFGANPPRLSRFGLAHRCVEINRRAVELAREAGARWVMADIGPTGEYLPPVGTADPTVWRDGFEAQVLALRDCAIDAIHLETFSDLREARIALEAARSIAPALPVLASLTFERRRRGFFTVMGDPLLPSLRTLVEAGAVAAGANCTLASFDLADLGREALAAGLPVVLQPNAGQPQRTGDHFTYEQRPEEFAADLAPLVGAGDDGGKRVLADGAGESGADDGARGRVVALGGCCGTDPRFIAALRERLGAAGVWP